MQWSRLCKPSFTQQEVEERKTRRDALSNAETQAIEEYLNSYEVSTVLPNKKACKNGMAGHQLKKSLKHLHAGYKFKTGSTVSLASFKWYMQKYFISITKAKLQHCLCEYCTNTMEKITAIIGFCILHNIPVQMLDDIEALSKATVCSTPMKACRERKCRECGVDELDDLFKPFKNYYNNELEWSKWALPDVSGKDIRGKQYNKKTLVKNVGTVDDLKK